MEYRLYCELKVNDRKTGKLLEVVDCVATVDDYPDEKVMDDIEPYVREDLEAELKYNYAKRDVIVELDMVYLSDEFDDDNDEEEDE